MAEFDIEAEARKMCAALGIDYELGPRFEAALAFGRACMLAGYRDCHEVVKSNGTFWGMGHRRAAKGQPSHQRAHC
jgi:hypothetical protein